MSRADCAFRCLGPCGASGRLQPLPRWNVPHHLPAPSAPAAVVDSAASLGAPSQSQRRQQSVCSPFKSLLPGLCHRILSWGLCPYLSFLGLRLRETAGTLVALAASAPSVGPVDSRAGARRASIHSLLAGVGVGGERGGSVSRLMVPWVLHLVLWVSVCP